MPAIGHETEGTTARSDGARAAREASPEDREWLDRARVLAHQGWGHVHPNPMVGCILVKNGQEVARGFHATYGGAHAERVALDRAGLEAPGATAYVSLEPCSHYGKTRPCVDALVGAGVARVVYGAEDPGNVAGGGGERLRNAGIDVVGPVWDPVVGRAENPAFHHAAAATHPFVAVKLATSLDGMISAAPDTRTTLTGVDAQQWTHRLRSGHEAVMVGATTARVDRPSLTVRDAPAGRVRPLRIVLDSRAALPTDGPLFRGLDDAPLHVFVAEGVASEAGVTRLQGAGANVHAVAVDAAGRLDPAAVLDACRDFGARSILCEGGGRWVSSLLERDLVGRLYVLVAPLLIGSSGVPAFPGGTLGPAGFRTAFPPRALGDDVLITLDRVAA